MLRGLRWKALRDRLRPRGARRRFSRQRHRSARQGRRAVAVAAADGGDRPLRRAPGHAPPDPRRADLLARLARGRAVARLHQAAARRGPVVRLHLAPAARVARRRRPHDGHAQRPRRLDRRPPQHLARRTWSSCSAAGRPMDAARDAAPASARAPAVRVTRPARRRAARGQPRRRARRDPRPRRARGQRPARGAAGGLRGHARRGGGRRPRRLRLRRPRRRRHLPALVDRREHRRLELRATGAPRADLARAASPR